MELNSVVIEGAVGGSQKWLRDLVMRYGGCAAITACDCSLYLAQNFGWTDLYPFDLQAVTKKDYEKFAKIMKPYLMPRLFGIDKLDTYINGYERYLKDKGEKRLKLTGLSATVPFREYAQAVKDRLAQQMPIPCLVLKHKNLYLKDYVWHWFVLMGCEEVKGQLLVKAVTYGNFQWLDLKKIWDSGYKKKGGLILFKRAIN